MHPEDRIPGAFFLVRTCLTTPVRRQWKYVSWGSVLFLRTSARYVRGSDMVMVISGFSRIGLI